MASIECFLSWFINDTVNFDGPTLAVAVLSFFVAVVSIIVSVIGYKFSKRVFYIQSKRLAHEGAEVHVRRMLEFISTAKLSRPRKDEWWQNRTDEQVEKYIASFERRNRHAFIELNISCSAFTLTRGLAYESYADATIGNVFCEFLKPYYQTLKHASKDSHQYRDLLLLYELWDLKHEMHSLRMDLKEVDRQNAGISREIFSLYRDMLPLLIRKAYHAIVYKDKEAKKQLGELLSTADRLKAVRKKFLTQSKRYRKNQKLFQKNERRLRKNMKHFQPLGLR